MSYRDQTLIPHLRQRTLAALTCAPRYTGHAYLLRDRLTECGLAVGGDLLAAELQWLADAGLVTLETVEGAHIATLTGRGLDVAEGRVTVAGVHRPLPGQG